MSSAATFCSSHFTRLVPGIGATGTASRPACPCTQASATCAGATPLASATPRTAPAIARVGDRLIGGPAITGEARVVGPEILGIQRLHVYRAGEEAAA